MLVPVILSGGSGSRLWPLSREEAPKQFLPLLEQQSLLQRTALRASAAGANAPLIVCNQAHRFLVAQQFAELGTTPRGIVLEPVARNTAPAIAAAACLLEASEGPDARMLVLAADHAIPNEGAFAEAVAQADRLAQEGEIVTFGIVPTHAETGYGYLKAGALQGGGRIVEAFIEKPNQDRADAFGMFLFPVGVLLEALERHAPAALRAARQAVSGATQDLDFLRLEEAAFAEAPSESIDYAVMEKLDRAVMVPLDAGWSDVGAWDALWSLGEKDDAGNVAQGDVLAVGTHNSYLRSGGRLLATVGVSDLLVVDTEDATLVAHRYAAQGVKTLVERLKKAGRRELVAHPTRRAPWGSARRLAEGEAFEAHLLTLPPGRAMASQRHQRRSEHWIVLEGSAEVTRNGETHRLGPHEAISIAAGDQHRLANTGPTVLKVLEVASGTIDPDDIERQP
ncbi:MAG: mannose-1-phosphate guanylyltransferase/mannose-6-phosphate isomerase [Gammaproteobacteria bacterium]|nr:mannose-1-phosphate guanylyltransferase/mannose-6-phosphate isomerase [Gammaproteobacteria bacterium]